MPLKKVKILKYEDYKTSVLKMLESANTEVPQKVVQCLEKEKPINNIERSKCREYYNEKLAEMVRKAERSIVDSYGYSY